MINSKRKRFMTHSLLLRSPLGWFWLVKLLFIVWNCIHLTHPIFATSARSQIASLTRNKIYVSREALKQFYVQFRESIACKYFSSRLFDFYALVLCQKANLNMDKTTKKTINRRRLFDVSRMLNQENADRSRYLLYNFKTIWR